MRGCAQSLTAMKAVRKILIALAIAPWIFGAIAVVDFEHGLIWLFFETVPYFPIYWLEDPFFKLTEVGWLVTIYGKVLGTVAYVVAIVVIKRWQLTSKLTATR